MMKFTKYPPLEKNQFFIDKTEVLEEVLSEFPSVYMEAFAAAGKTTMVRMFLEKHAGELDYVLLDMHEEKKDPDACAEKLRRIYEEQRRRAAANADEESTAKERPLYLVIEQLEPEIPEQIPEALCDYLSSKPQEMRCIIISRYSMPECIGKLVWKRLISIVSQRSLSFSPDDEEKLLLHYGSTLDVRKFYELVGGHAGCADLMARIAGEDEGSLKDEIVRNNVTRAGNYGSFVMNYKKKGLIKNEDAFLLRIRKLPVVENYIEQDIISSLSPNEKELLRLAALCPKLNEELCREVWGVENPKQLIESLTRKGFLRYDDKGYHWHVNRLYAVNYADEQGTFDENNADYWRALGTWYEKSGYIREAILSYRKSGDQELYKSAMMKFCWYVPFTGIDLKPAKNWNEPDLRIIYLRALCDYMNDDLVGFDREKERAKDRWQSLMKEDTKSDHSELFMRLRWRATEIYLNLLFIDPKVSLSEFLDFTEQQTKFLYDGRKYTLYSILGGATTFLCGVRDLTGLFSCLKREENRQMRIWKNAFGNVEYHVYQLARMQYYMLTNRQEALLEEDQEILVHLPMDQIFELDAYDEELKQYVRMRTKTQTWKGKMARLLILTNLTESKKKSEHQDLIRFLLDSLYQEEDYNIRLNAMNTECMYLFYQGNAEPISRLLKYMESVGYPKIGNLNFQMFGTWVKAYILMNQYVKAEKLIRMAELYLRKYGKRRFLAELLFQKAVILWALGNHSQAMQAVIESFLISNEARYTSFYMIYGQVGLEVLEAYIEWMSRNSRGNWYRKKKYNYGNVLRMPYEDYLYSILRGAKHKVRLRPKDAVNSGPEKLTMMETLMLQCISRGLTNAQICEELNLKLSTVKSHLYSLYKKLGVKNRAQAMIYAREANEGNERNE